MMMERDDRRYHRNSRDRNNASRNYRDLDYSYNRENYDYNRRDENYDYNRRDEIVRDGRPIAYSKIERYSRSRSRDRREKSFDRDSRSRDHRSNNSRNRDYHDNFRRNEKPRDGHNRIPSNSVPLSIVVDPNLPQLDDDPRVDKAKGIKHVKTGGGGRNTESFDPRDTLVRPDLRVIVGPNREVYNKPLKHDDVIIVPEFFCKEDDWSLYYKLIEEIRDLQSKKSNGSEFISWHEGAHLIVKDPKSSPTFQMIQNKIAAYFNIKTESIGTRFNWYRDSTDFKPFHHDS